MSPKPKKHKRHSSLSLTQNANLFDAFPKVDLVDSAPRDTPVYLNVYDLTTVNSYIFWAGLGVFHTGVEVHGVEYAFGAHDVSASGIFEVTPRQCPGFKFRRSIYIGTTCKDAVQVREFVEEHSMLYCGDTYHLICKNCNHFCGDLCYRLTGNKIPKWINRLAKIGSVCSCLLPKALRSSAVLPGANYKGTDCEKKKLTGSSGFKSSVISSSQQKESEVSISSLFLESHYKGCITPWEPLSARSVL